MQNRFALVMSGGGARGAYEVGVLSYLLDEFPTRLGRPPRFDIVTGTSVGAIHACYVAATLGEAGAGARLAEIWRSLDVGNVYALSMASAVALPVRLLGLGRRRAPVPIAGEPERLQGLLDTRPLERLVHRVIPWANLRARVDGGEVEAVAIAATEIASGKSIVWIDSHAGALPDWPNDPFVEARAATLGPTHALASAAIPFLFPALRVGADYYCDGGLRLNTPLAPALRLGADRLLIVGLRHRPPPGTERALAEHRQANYSSLAYLAGKVLNALLLDHVDYDVDRLRVMNAILATGTQAYGSDFTARINATLLRLHETPYRFVRHVYFQPSRDLGVLAAECLDHQERPRGLRGWLFDSVVRSAVHGVAAEADLLSYVLFDRCYAGHLIALGREDAEARAEELLALFEDS